MVLPAPIRLRNRARDLNRWLPLVKWFLAIPNFIVLMFLWIAATVILIIAWFAILHRAIPERDVRLRRRRRAMGQRVIAYAFLLVTDGYPHFSLAP